MIINLIVGFYNLIVLNFEFFSILKKNQILSTNFISHQRYKIIRYKIIHYPLTISAEGAWPKGCPLRDTP
jgi:hypothetical protein